MRARGTMTERQPGVWRIRVYVGRDPLTGTPRQVSKTFKGTEKQAHKALTALLAEVDKGKYGGTAATFGVLLTRWLDHIEAMGNHSPTTIRTYRNYVERKLRQPLGSRPLNKLSAHDLDHLYAALIGRGLTPSTVHQIHSIVSRACRQAVSWGWLETNPAKSATPPSVRQPRVEVPSPAEVLTLIAAAAREDHEMAMFLMLAAHTGARRGELCALRWEDVVDGDPGTIEFRRSLASVKGGTLMKGTKTHAVRIVSMTPGLRHALIAHKARRLEELVDVGAVLVPGHFICSYTGGEKPISPDTLTHYVARLAKQLGLDLHVHSLRHFTATQLIGAGVDVRTVAGRLGHADASTTLRVYAHVLKAQDRAAAVLLGRVLEDPIQIPFFESLE